MGLMGGAGLAVPADRADLHLIAGRCGTHAVLAVHHPDLHRCIPWVTALALLGRAAGDDGERLQKQLHYIDYALILLAIGGLVWWLLRARARKSASVS